MYKNLHVQFVLGALLAGMLLFSSPAWGQSFLPSQPEMDVNRVGTPVPDGSTESLGSQSTTFALTYTIENTGNGALNLTGATLVQISTQVSCTVSVTVQPSATVAAGGSTTFTVSCTPAAGPGSLYFFNISIESDDADENPYDWGLMAIMSGGPLPPPPGELAVDRGGSPVADGLTDDVGLITPAAAFNMTYTVANTGLWSGIALTGSPLVAISCQVNCTTTVTAQPASSIAQSSSTTFTLSCTPTGSPFSFQVSFDNTDLDENPYNWTVQGTTPLSAEMDVDRAGSAVADGATDSLGDQDAGTQIDLTYTIFNTGSGPLDITSGDISGQTNCTVTVVTQAQATVLPAGSTTFTLACTPTTEGTAFSFSVSINANDPDENPYNWTVSGSAVEPQDDPPADPGGGCSPSPGVTGPVNILGLLATYLVGFGLWFLTRRRFEKQ